MQVKEMQIKSIKDPKDAKSVDAFATKEWAIFNRERNYKWKETKHTFAAYEDKKVVGFASLKINGGAAYLSQLIVLKEARRKMIGSILLQKFEQYAKRNNCHVAYLETSERHSEALRFYKRHGYKIMAKLNNNKFHLTWYFMAKPLR
jgi:ribosomal protein S18 acetylase RimI-like enzyme